MTSHRGLGAVVAALAAVILMAAPASATQWQVVSKESGTSAFAANFNCTPNPGGTTTCSGTSLDVFVGKSNQLGTSTVHTQRVCYNQFSDTFDTTTGAFIHSTGVFGCAFDAGTLSINDLTSITLAATEISLIQFECDSNFSCTESPDGTVVVAGTWTGVGPIGSQKGKFRFNDGTCVQADAQKGNFRQASFSGSVGGASFTATEAGMGQGTFMFRTTCGLL